MANQSRTIKAWFALVTVTESRLGYKSTQAQRRITARILRNVPIRSTR